LGSNTKDAVMKDDPMNIDARKPLPLLVVNKVVKG
jgi:hypothetical protein